MTDGQKRRIKTLVDDYRAAGYTSDKIRKGAKDIASRLKNPHPIDPVELNKYLTELGL